MTPERWQEIESIFQSALKREPDKRAAFLDQACVGDKELRREVEALLGSHEQASSFIEAPPSVLSSETLEEQRVDLPDGQRISHYKVIRELGSGGMGKVYLAQDIQLRRFVALKLLLAEYTKKEEHLRRFKQEALAASALNHPNILTVYEIGQVDTTHFIATEFVEGVTLRQHIASTQIEMSKALDVAIQVASALAAAHAKGILHRDIKPENIMLRPDGYIKVLDFGLAKLIEPLSDQAASSDLLTVPKVSTAPGMVIGTINYMSPEQLRGPSLDGRTDIWSLGVVLYEIVAGRAPFDGSSPSDVAASILYREPLPLARYSGEVLPELERIVTKALAKDREARYQTVKDLQIDLQNLKQELQSKARLERSVMPRPIAGAAVTTNSEQSTIETACEQPARPTKSTEKISRHKKAAVVTLMILLAGTAFWFYRFFWPPPALFQTITVTRIPYADKATRAVISADGKYLAQVENDGGNRSLWVRRLDVSGKQQMDQQGQIIPPRKADLYGLTFSLDSNYIYYVRSEGDIGVLYRAHILEGVPKKLIEDVDSGITLSPDGKRLAFLRKFPSEAKDALVIANADGGDERVLLTRKKPDFLSGDGFAWSPDGRTIACGAGSYTAKGYLSVIEVNVEDGTEEPITPQRWWTIGRLAWLGDKSGLVMTAADRGASTNQQIWYVSYPSGEARRITNDTHQYTGVSLTKDSKTLVTVQSRYYSDLWITPNGDVSRAKKITSNWSGENISWTPDGKILFESQASGNEDVWIMNSDGTGEKQLTFDPNFDYSPTALPDGRYVVFVSNRTGNSNIWRMDTDGSNVKRLTNGSGEKLPHCSPDGRWVVYTSYGSSKTTLWKVSIDGGVPIQITSESTDWPVVSPDGRWIACNYTEEQQTAPWVTAVIPFEGGPPTKVFDNISSNQTRWTPDSRALTYIVTRNGVSNIWSQPLDGGQPKQLTDFKELSIYSFDWSNGGKLLACERGFNSRNVVLFNDIR